jgi:hypothetical protein
MDNGMFELWLPSPEAFLQPSQSGVATQVSEGEPFGTAPHIYPTRSRKTAENRSQRRNCAQAAARNFIKV